jgi:hypothetical protein
VKLFVAACVVVVLGIAAAIGGAYLVALHAEQALCPVLELFTRHPVTRPADPAANPSRVQNYQVYADVRQAERGYRCPV